MEGEASILLFIVSFINKESSKKVIISQFQKMDINRKQKLSQRLY